MRKFEEVKMRALPQLEAERHALAHARFDFSDMLVDLHAAGELEQHYLDYLEKQQQMMVEKEIQVAWEKMSKAAGDAQGGKGVGDAGVRTGGVKSLHLPEVDDQVCQICNDGNSVDDNLIVYCSVSAARADVNVLPLRRR